MSLPRRRFTVIIDEIARDEPVGLRMAKQLRIYADLMEETVRKAAEIPIVLPGLPYLRSDTVQPRWTDPITGATVSWSNEIYEPDPSDWVG